MILREIMQVISQIKKNRKPYYTNYYLGFSMDQEFQIRQGKETILFWIRERNFYRMYYFTSDAMELCQLLKAVDKPMVVDVICRKKNEMESVMLEAGYELYAVFCKRQIDLGTKGRISLDEGVYGEFYDPDILQYAKQEDVEEIFQILETVFDARKDHLPSKEELQEIINRENVVLCKLDNRIVSFYIYRIEGKKLYSNFSYNMASGELLYSIERKVRELAYENHGVTQLYAWFDMTNKKALRRTVLLDTEQRDYIYVKG